MLRHNFSTSNKSYISTYKISFEGKNNIYYMAFYVYIKAK